MALRWRADAGHIIECWLSSFVVLQEIRTIIAKKLYIFVFFFSGEEGRDGVRNP